jgi:cystathionine beta-synthase
VLLPDSGRSYLSKIYNDGWMRDQGFTERFPSHPCAGDLLHSHQSGQVRVPFITVRLDQTVSEAIGTLHAHGISQMPVVVPNESNGKPQIVGSIQERTLLEKIFKNPDIVTAPVEKAMDAPLPIVDATEMLEDIFPLFSSSSPALIVEKDGEPIGILSRADVLEFVAQQRNRH